jgi:hypothetical protein
VQTGRFSFAKNNNLAEKTQFRSSQQRKAWERWEQGARPLCAIIPLNVNYKKKIKIYLLIVNF